MIGRSGNSLRMSSGNALVARSTSRGGKATSTPEVPLHAVANDPADQHDLVSVVLQTAHNRRDVRMLLEDHTQVDPLCSIHIRVTIPLQTRPSQRLHVDSNPAFV